EQRPYRGGRDPLAQRRDHATGDEDVFGAHGATSSFFKRLSASARSAGVSTPIESANPSPAQMVQPASSHRSCSGDSARSRGERARAATSRSASARNA